MARPARGPVCLRQSRRAYACTRVRGGPATSRRGEEGGPTLRSRWSCGTGKTPRLSCPRALPCPTAVSSPVAVVLCVRRGQPRIPSASAQNTHALTSSSARIASASASADACRACALSSSCQRAAPRRPAQASQTPLSSPRARWLGSQHESRLRQEARITRTKAPRRGPNPRREAQPWP